MLLPLLNIFHFSSILGTTGFFIKQNKPDAPMLPFREMMHQRLSDTTPHDKISSNNLPLGFNNSGMAYIDSDVEPKIERHDQIIVLNQKDIDAERLKLHKMMIQALEEKKLTGERVQLLFGTTNSNSIIITIIGSSIRLFEGFCYTNATLPEYLSLAKVQSPGMNEANKITRTQWCLRYRQFLLADWYNETSKLVNISNEDLLITEPSNLDCDSLRADDIMLGLYNLTMDDYDSVRRFIIGHEISHIEHNRRPVSYYVKFILYTFIGTLLSELPFCYGTFMMMLMLTQGVRNFIKDYHSSVELEKKCDLSSAKINGVKGGILYFEEGIKAERHLPIKSNNNTFVKFRDNFFRTHPSFEDRIKFLKQFSASDHPQAPSTNNSDNLRNCN